MVRQCQGCSQVWSAESSRVGDRRGCWRLRHQRPCHFYFFFHFFSLFFLSPSLVFVLQDSNRAFFLAFAQRDRQIHLIYPINQRPSLSYYMGLTDPSIRNRRRTNFDKDSSILTNFHGFNPYYWPSSIFISFNGQALIPSKKSSRYTIQIRKPSRSWRETRSHQLFDDELRQRYPSRNHKTYRLVFLIDQIISWNHFGSSRLCFWS